MAGTSAPSTRGADRQFGLMHLPLLPEVYRLSYDQPEGWVPLMVTGPKSQTFSPILLEVPRQPETCYLTEKTVAELVGVTP